VNLALLLVLAYLVGAFPSSVVLGRVFRGVDVRREGSGNAGATNAWRVFGWRIGLSVMAIDAAKGALAATAIPRIPVGELPVSLAAASIFCGAAAIVGHVFPLYIGFRGGKGVATGAGMLAAVAPIPVAVALGVFALAVTTTGWVSLGSLLGAWSVPITVALLPPTRDGLSYPLLLGLTAGLALFITVTHRNNVRRLLQGTESRFPRLQIWRVFLRRRQESDAPPPEDGAGSPGG
jgi:acyl phosphate:glycerol-3-phosphate acyltransferase